MIVERRIANGTKVCAKALYRFAPLAKLNTLYPFIYTEVQVRCSNAQWNMTLRRS
jgi:hypothetical protein